MLSPFIPLSLCITYSLFIGGSAMWITNYPEHDTIVCAANPKPHSHTSSNSGHYPQRDFPLFDRNVPFLRAGQRQKIFTQTHTHQSPSLRAQTTLVGMISKELPNFRDGRIRMLSETIWTRDMESGLPKRQQRWSNIASHKTYGALFSWRSHSLFSFMLALRKFLRSFLLGKFRENRG